MRPSAMGRCCLLMSRVQWMGQPARVTRALRASCAAWACRMGQMMPPKRLKRAQCRSQVKAHSPKRAGDIGKHASRRRFGLAPVPVASSLFLAVKRHAHEGNNAEPRRAQQHVEEALCARRGRNKTEQQRWCTVVPT